MAVFIDITQKSRFSLNNVLDKILNTLNTEKNKIIAIMGDFNCDMLKIDQDGETCDFFDLMLANGFRPLILQPTRVTLSTATLIDNIYINDIGSSSVEGHHS